MRKRSIWPNLTTIGNLFFGFWAILHITRGQFLTACWLIVVAAILDGLDGALARKAAVPSRFGAELDSLADAVSFGVAPALLVYYAVLEPFGTAGLLLAFLPLLGGVIRLARFNINPSKSPRRRMFVGLPIPCSALTISGFFLYIHSLHGEVVDTPLWFSLIPAVSLLMVSPIPYRPMPVVTIHKSKYPRLSIALLLSSVAAVIWNPALTIFPLMMIYIIIGPAEWGLLHLRRVRSARQQGELSEAQVLPQRRAIRLVRRRQP